MAKDRAQCVESHDRSPSIRLVKVLLSEGDDDGERTDRRIDPGGEKGLHF